MNVAKYLFLFGAAAMTFLIGHSAHAGVRYLFRESNLFANERSYCGSAQQSEQEIPMIDMSSENGYELLGGNYYLFDEALMKGFPDLDHIEIETTGDLSAPLRGSVHTKRDHKFLSLALESDRLAFTTATIRGVSYQFSGTIGPEDADGLMVIRGRLMKLKKGQTVGSMYASFYPSGNCSH